MMTPRQRLSLELLIVLICTIFCERTISYDVGVYSILKCTFCACHSRKQYFITRWQYFIYHVFYRPNRAAKWPTECMIHDVKPLRKKAEEVFSELVKNAALD
jgi:hypothetical protein